MKNKSDQNPENFDDLESLFTVLRAIPQRDPTKAAGTRARFYSALNNFTQPAVHKLTMYLKLKEKISMSTPRRKAVYLSLAIVLVLALVLFSGAGITAVAASRSLPGDGLFSVKTGIEKTQVNLQGSDADQAYLSLKFAERRLEELQMLVESGRYSDLSEGINAFQVNIQQALTAAAAMMQYDPHGAQELYSKISEFMLKFAAALEEYSLLLPVSDLNLLDDGYRFQESMMDVDDDEVDDMDDDMDEDMDEDMDDDMDDDVDDDMDDDVDDDMDDDMDDDDSDDDDNTDDDSTDGDSTDDDSTDDDSTEEDDDASEDD